MVNIRSILGCWFLLACLSIVKMPVGLSHEDNRTFVQPLKVFQLEPGSYVSDAKFSPDGSMVASVSSDGKTRLWNVATGKLERILEIPNETVSTIAFSPDNKFLAGSGSGGGIVIWDTRTGTTFKTLRGRIAAVYFLDFPSAQRLISAGEQMRSASDDSLLAESWDLATAQVKTTSVGLEFPVFIPGSTVFATEVTDGEDNQKWELRDLLTGKTKRSLQRRPDAFAANGQVMVTSGFDTRGWSASGVYLLWDLRVGRLISVVRNYNGDAGAINFSPDGSLLVMGNSRGNLSKRGEVSVWDVKSGVLQWRGEHHGKVTQVMFSSDGKSVVSASDDGTVKIWNAR